MIKHAKGVIELSDLKEAHATDGGRWIKSSCLEQEKA